MDVVFKEEYRGLRAILSGDLDHHGAEQIRDRIDGEITETFPEILYLDFSGVEFMDSSAVGLIIGRYRLMNEYHGEVKIEGLSARCRKLLELSGLRSILNF